MVTNARCLSEGIDIPDIDCVLFADPRKSTIDIVQAVGRALRKSESKKLGYIIIPVIQDGNQPDADSLKSESYDHLLMTLRALASNDDRIVEYFRAISQGRAPGRGEYPIEIDIPIGRKIDAKLFAESIELKLWSRLAKLSWRPFEEARDFVQELDLNSQSEWVRYCRGQIPEKPPLPKDIPLKPDSAYKNKGWISWGDWLGTGAIASRLKDYRPFKEARAFAQNMNLKSQNEWRKYSKGQFQGKPPLPNDIPAAPNQTYNNKGWKGWGDWLGTGTISPNLRKYRPFKEARAFVDSLSLKSRTEWTKYSKGQLPGKTPLPSDIPVNPNQTYKNKGWNNWGDWLGTGAIAPRLRKYRPFKEAQIFVHRLKLKNAIEWRNYCKEEIPEKPPLPNDIPVKPDRTYKDNGWQGWGDWLGTGTVAFKLRKHRPFKQARAFVYSLNLINRAEWRKYCQGELPGKPSSTSGYPDKPN